MAMKTRAAVLTAPRKMEMREISIPEVGEESGLVRIEVTGVCGVDWPAYTGHKIDRFRPPIILGHEIVGRIVRLGKKAATRWGVEEGDRIVMEEYAPCGRCEYCMSGYYYLCGGISMEKMYGFTSLDVAPGLWGGYSEYVFLDPQALFHKMDDSVSLEAAPFYVSISNGIRWVQREAEVGVGDTVVILGPGQLGLGCVVAAKEVGAGRIIITGRAKDARRLAVARGLGATHTVDVDAEVNVVERIAALTDGQMADAVINVASFFPGAAQQAIEIARVRGIVVMAGGAHETAELFSSDLLTQKEITMKGVRGRTGRDMKKAIALLESGRHSIEKAATHRFSIQETENALLTVGGEGASDAVHVSVYNEFD